MSEPQTLLFRMTIEQANFILELLGQQPYVRVHGLIAQMQAHFQRLLVQFIVTFPLGKPKEMHIAQQTLVYHRVVEVQLQFQCPLEHHVPVQFCGNHTR